jgi:hypothetical protein
MVHAKRFVSRCEIILSVFRAFGFAEARNETAKTSNRRAAIYSLTRCQEATMVSGNDPSFGGHREDRGAASTDRPHPTRNGVSRSRAEGRAKVAQNST